MPSLNILRSWKKKTAETKRRLNEEDNLPLHQTQAVPDKVRVPLIQRIQTDPAPPLIQRIQMGPAPQPLSSLTLLERTSNPLLTR